MLAGCVLTYGWLLKVEVRGEQLQNPIINPGSFYLPLTTSWHKISPQMILPSKDLNSTKEYSLVITRVVLVHRKSLRLFPLGSKCLNINKTYLFYILKPGQYPCPINNKSLFIPFYL